MDTAQQAGLAKPNRILQVLLLGVLCALPPLSIDMPLPAMAAIAADFDSDVGKAGLTLSVFMIGFGIMPLVYGFLSDRVGRKGPLLVGVALFALGGAACALAPSIDALLAARLLQGAGAAAGPTLAYAAARDQLAGQALQKRLAALTIILSVAPVIAPSLGVVALAWDGWRGVYWVLAASGAVLFVALLLGLTETWTARSSSARSGSQAAFGGRALTYGAVRGLSSGALFGYVAGSPFLLIQYFELSYRAYGWLFGFTALGIVIGAGVSSGLAKGRAYRAIVHNGVLLTLLGAAIAGAALLLEVGGVVLAMAGFWLSTFGYGLLMPAASQMALSRADSAAGAVSAGLNTFQMICMTAASAVVAIGLGAFGPTVIVGVMVLFGAAASLLLPLLDEAEAGT